MIPALRHNGSLRKSISNFTSLHTRPHPSSASRPLHRQHFSTLLLSANGSIRRHYATPSPAALRRIQARPISMGGFVRLAARAFRVPAGIATLGVGGAGYATYKVDGKLFIMLFVSVPLNWRMRRIQERGNSMGQHGSRNGCRYVRHGDGRTESGLSARC